MIAHWPPLLPQLRADFRRFGLELPPAPVVDGRWHRGRGGHYLLDTRLPPLAMCCADGRKPQVWRNDDRLPSLWQQHIAAVAAGQCPNAAGFCQRDSDLDPRNDAPVTNVLAQSATPTSELAKAREWLHAMLADGSIASAYIRAQATHADISWATVRRAALSLGIVATREGFGRGGRWTWRLP